jgi:hypothetical protein
VPEIPPIDGKQPIAPSDRAPRARARRRVDTFGCGMFSAAAALFLAWLPLIRHRTFDPDEFEHAHAAWCVFRGMLPYRDFFEHHTPWYYFVLSRFFRFFDVGTSIESARRFLLLGRGLSVILATLSAILVFKIGKWCRCRRVGLLAALFFVSQPFFLMKTMEIRPDVLALPWFLGCLWLVLRGLAAGTAPVTKGLRHFLGAGLALGAAVMCTQKMLFTLPGILLGLTLWALAGVRARQPHERSHPTATGGLGRRGLFIAAFLFGVAVPAAATWAVFALQGGGAQFITDNFLLNAKWKHFETGQLQRLFETSWPILLLCLIGSALALLRFSRRRPQASGELVLLCTLLGFFGGLLVMPSAHSQYYLPPLAIACVLAAKGLVFLVEGGDRRASAVRLVLALGLLGLLPLRALREALDWSNEGQLARLRFVLENTRPDDVVMDGWQGLGVFRPHAFHYFFLHAETAAVLPRRDLISYLGSLERGQIRPRMIVMDANLAALGPRFIGFVRMHYVSRDGFIYFARDAWQPFRRTGPRNPQPL